MQMIIADSFLKGFMFSRLTSKHINIIRILIVYLHHIHVYNIYYNFKRADFSVIEKVCPKWKTLHG